MPFITASQALEKIRMPFWHEMLIAMPIEFYMVSSPHSDITGMYRRVWQPLCVMWGGQPSDYTVTYEGLLAVSARRTCQGHH